LKVITQTGRAQYILYLRFYILAMCL